MEEAFVKTSAVLYGQIRDFPVRIRQETDKEGFETEDLEPYRLLRRIGPSNYLSYGYFHPVPYYCPDTKTPMDLML